MGLKVNRRKFLKLLPFLAAQLIDIKWPCVINGASKIFQNQKQPNILILLFDALSAKNVSIYGYHRDTTPNFARFAEKAVVYHSHYATANFTSPGTASLLTGVYPWSHRAFHLYGTVVDKYERMNLFSLIPQNYYKIAYTHNFLVTALLQQFSNDINLWKKTGDLCLYAGAFSEHILRNDHNIAYQGESNYRWGLPLPASLFLSWVHKAYQLGNQKLLNREYGHLFPRGLPREYTSYFVLEDAIDWIKDRLKEFPKPFMGYFHFMPPHGPYNTRLDFIDAFRDGWKPVVKRPHFFSEGHSDQFLNRRRREYDEYIAYTDAEFGRLVDFMEQSGLMANTYLILTSDHGESFERGIQGHATPTLYEALIRIPLLISKPGQERREDVYSATSCIDLLPTLMRVTGQSIPDWFEGKILPMFGNEEVSDNRSIFAMEAKTNHKQYPLTKATIAVIKDQYKLIHYFGYENYENDYELYNLADDPEELEDLYATRKSVAASLQNELLKKLQEVNNSNK